MNPGDIGPHPDAPDYYIPMGKPKSMTDNDCQTLMVRLVGATGDMVKEQPIRIVSVPLETDVMPGFLSEWVPSPEDLAALNAGAPLRMLVVGQTLPPTNLWVRGSDEQ